MKKYNIEVDEVVYDADLLLELWEERAAILEYDSGYTREESEKLAANMYGFESKYRLINWVNDLKESQNV